MNFDHRGPILFEKAALTPQKSVDRKIIWGEMGKNEGTFFLNSWGVFYSWDQIIPLAKRFFFNQYEK